LPIIGLLVAAIFATPDSRTFDLIVCAALGFLIADLGVVRLRLDELLKDVERLKKEFRRRQETQEAPSGPHEVAKEAPGIVYPEYKSPPLPPLPPLPPERPWQDIDPPAAARPAPTAPLVTRSTQESALVAAVRGFFTGGNTLVRVGIIVLFFGVAFLLRYMAEHSHIPIEVRLSGIALAAVALIVFGWRLRKTRGGYALALQGGGVGILYLLIFGAMRLYSILPAGIAFPLLALIAALSAILAILQNSMSFAILAVSGGFLAPVLASTGQGSHIALFSYYAVLNFGIVAIAWFKAWRPLNVVGFAFTFAIGIAWGVLKYRPEDFATTEPFLILFFLLYLGIAILFTLRQPTKSIGYIDGTLIFGTPIIAFSIQSGMLHARLMSLAYSAIVLSALYLAIAYILKRRNSDSHKLLFESFMALSVAFLTLAVPLALDARWNAATWALEGAALIWVGCRQSRILPRVFGALLSIAAGFVALTEFNFANNHPAMPLGGYLGIVLQSAAAIFSARTLQAHREQLKEAEHLGRDALFWGGVALWLLASVSELHSYIPTFERAASLFLATFTALCSSEIHRRTQLGVAKFAALLQLPVMLVFAIFTVLNGSHPFAAGGWWAWPAAFAAWYFLMFRHEGPAREFSAKALNSTAAWLLCAVLSWEFVWQVDKYVAAGNTWSMSVWVVVPAFLLWHLPKLVTRVKWPFARNREAYLFVAGVGIALYLGVWSLLSNVDSTGDSAPLAYYPLLNPLDLAQVLTLLALARYWRFLRMVEAPANVRMDKRIPLPALAALAFLWLNALLLRTLHQYFGVQLNLEHLMASTLVQTSLSLFWTVLALTAMLVAARKHARVIWLVGAALLVVVIAKLFLIDLSRIGSVERIVSFVGVGLLMLVVGYFSPIPPSRASRP
jgi:uncharacterized membrane protein